MTFHGVARVSLGSVFSASATAVWVVTRATGSGMAQIYPLPGRVMKAGRNPALRTGAMRLGVRGPRGSCRGALMTPGTSFDGARGWASAVRVHIGLRRSPGPDPGCDG